MVTYAEVAGVPIRLPEIRRGDVVALLGDFDRGGIAALLRLLDLGAIVVPLVRASAMDHDYFFEAAHVQYVVENGHIVRSISEPGSHRLLDELRRRQRPGVILFSSGTSGRPKAILHDFSTFLARYRTPRPALRTLTFLLFDHIGGLNTLLHTLFNRGTLVTPSGRTPERIVADIKRFDVELLPTTPTFLRMLLLSGFLDEADFSSLRVITYGTERMDQASLDILSRKLPAVDFRQTYGMSELGILRVKSRARDSVWMKIGGEGVTTRVIDGVLQIHAQHRMMGYLNESSPFAEDGWYDTGDVVDQDGEYVRIVGRAKEVINVGGLKVLPGEIERIALLHPDVAYASAAGVANPLTGQHVEVLCEPRSGKHLDRAALKAHFGAYLPEHFVPQRIRIGKVTTTHRFKRGGAPSDVQKA